MGKLSMGQRKALPKSDFAVPSKAPGPGSYPMPDPQHAAVAQGLAAMHGGPVKAVKKKAKQKFPSTTSGPSGNKGGMRVAPPMM